MSEAIKAANTIRVIEKSELLLEVMKQKKAGRRLSQACASYRDEKYELSYSFADDVTCDYETLRVVVELDEEVPSITEMFPYAMFYENEMAELFGVKIKMIEIDYHDTLYRIKAKTPFLPEGAMESVLKKREEAKKAEEEAAAKAAAEKAAAEAKAAAGQDGDGAADDAAKTAGAKAAAAKAAEETAENIPDIVTLPNGKTMDLTKLAPAARDKVIANLKAKGVL